MYCLTEPLKLNEHMIRSTEGHELFPAEAPSTLSTFGVLRRSTTISMNWLLNIRVWCRLKLLVTLMKIVKSSLSLSPPLTDRSAEQSPSYSSMVEFTLGKNPFANSFACVFMQSFRFLVNGVELCLLCI